MNQNLPEKKEQIRAKKREKSPVREEHPCTKTTNTKQKCPLFGHKTLMRSWLNSSSTLPSHFAQNFLSSKTNQTATNIQTKPKAKSNKYPFQISIQTTQQTQFQIQGNQKKKKILKTLNRTQSLSIHKQTNGKFVCFITLYLSFYIHKRLQRIKQKSLYLWGGCNLCICNENVAVC